MEIGRFFGEGLLLLGFVSSVIPSAMAARKTAHPRSKLVFADGTALRQRFGQLVAAAQTNRTVDSPGGKRAFDWLQAQARSLSGWTVRVQTFTPDVKFAELGYDAAFVPFKSLDPKTGTYQLRKAELDGFDAFAEGLKGKTLSNLILRKEGTDKKLASRPVVVTAHFDTITWRRDPFKLFPELKAEGANANGAAVVALLAMAESLKDLKPRRPLELVFTDAGEAFFLGAHAYAEQLSATGAQADAVVLDMIGHDAPVANHLRVYARTDGQPGWMGDEEIARVVRVSLTANGLATDLTKTNAARADNYAFRRAIHSSVLVGVDWEYGFDDEHYHSARDTADAVDWNFAAKVGRSVTEAVSVLVAHP